MNFGETVENLNFYKLLNYKIFVVLKIEIFEYLKYLKLIILHF